MSETSIPWVTVVCTCYNHANYVTEALESVVCQTYPNVQLIVVDNCSSDNSGLVISSFTALYPNIIFLQNKENKGICRAFNEAVKLAKGKYLIDLAADDVLLPDRIAKQVTQFEQLSDNYAVIYSNIELIGANGKHIGYSYKEDECGPSGDLLTNLLTKHFLPSPSTMFKASVFFSLGGYNELLAFEDFDYWIRCARHYKFYYLDIVSTKKRILPSSLSTHFYATHSDIMLESTYETFRWISTRLKTESEEKAFVCGVRYYFRQATWLGHFSTASKFKSLSRKSKSTPDILTCLSILLFHLRMNVSSLYTLYNRKRGKK